MEEQPSLRLAFMGTPAFSVPALHALMAAGHEVACVYSQPPRAKGRGHNEQKSPVHEAAEKAGIEVRTPKSLRGPDVQREFQNLHLDACVVVAYGLLLPKPILRAPRFGCLNIHASLLPRWRGAAPIQRALLEGDKETGVTIMQMDEGLDTGPMWMMQSTPILPNSTAQSLHDELSAMGAEMIVEALDGIADGTLMLIQQPANSITYAEKLKKEESDINWLEDAAVIERKVRALNPWPGVGFTCKGEKIKVLEAELATASDRPAGTLLDDRCTIACGLGALRLLKVQRPGKNPVDGAAFLRGFSAKTGELL